MKLKVDTDVLTMEGKPFDPPSTLRAALYGACIADIRGSRELGTVGDERLGLQEKLELHELGARILLDGKGGDGTVELSAKEATTVLERGAKIYTIPFLGQINAMIEKAKKAQAPRAAEAA